MSKSRLILLALLNWNLNSLLILFMCILEKRASITILPDWPEALFSACWRLYLPVPVGVFNSQNNPPIKKSGVLLFFRGTNTISFSKYSSKIRAADSSLWLGPGWTSAGIMIEHFFIRASILTLRHDAKHNYDTCYNKRWLLKAHLHHKSNKNCLQMRWVTTAICLTPDILL